VYQSIPGYKKLALKEQNDVQKAFSTTSERLRGVMQKDSQRITTNSGNGPNEHSSSRATTGQTLDSGGAIRGKEKEIHVADVFRRYELANRDLILALRNLLTILVKMENNK
jgi:hypothetical protein